MSSQRMKRHAFILDEVERLRVVSITDLGEQLATSRETIRSDLAMLAGQRRLRQLRGGAAAIEQTEPAMHDRERVNADGKMAIAAFVAQLIPGGASLVIDSGSTTLAAARALTGHADLTIYTNDVRVALTLVDSARAVHLLGGRMGRNEHSMNGPDTLEMLAGYRTDFALVGVGGLDSANGFTDYDREAASLRDAMLASASTPVFLVGSEKFGRTVPARLRNAGRARLVLTDQVPPADIAACLHDLSLDVMSPPHARPIRNSKP